jgi:hypothetical protein
MARLPDMDGAGGVDEMEGNPQTQGEPLPPTATPPPLPTATPLPLPTATPPPLPTATPPPLPTATPTPVRQVEVVPEGETIGIYLLEPASGQRTHVVSVDSSFNHPLFRDFVSLSPDGQEVLYVTSEILNPLNATIWVARTDGSGAYPVARFQDQLWSVAPVWSPDSSQIAYVTKMLDTAPDEGLQLWRMQRDGSNPTLVAQGGQFRPSLFWRIPQGVIRWSADGTHLEFKDRWSTPPSLFQVNVQTSVITRTRLLKEPAVVEQLVPRHGTNLLPCPVPLFNQKNYGQVMSPCEQRICRAGCAVTAATMLLSYYGSETDPAGLSNCMGQLACPLWWGEVATVCSQGSVQGVSFLEPFQYATLDQEVAAGRPVIVHVTTPTGGTHFVVVNGGEGQVPSGYTISDPVDGSNNRTLARYSEGGWDLVQTYRYNGQPACPDGYGEDPDGGDIAYGEVITGTINPSGDMDDFFLTTAAGDTIDVRVVASNDTSPDPIVVLYNPDETYLAHDDDSGGMPHAQLGGAVSREGRYRIRVIGYGESIGPYTLQVQRGP